MMVLPWQGADLSVLANGLGSSRGRLHFQTAGAETSYSTYRKRGERAQSAIGGSNRHALA